MRHGGDKVRLLSRRRELSRRRAVQRVRGRDHRQNGRQQSDQRHPATRGVDGFAPRKRSRENERQAGVAWRERHAARAGSTDEWPPSTLEKATAQALALPQRSPLSFELGSACEPECQSFGVRRPDSHQRQGAPQQDTTASRSEIASTPELPRVHESLRPGTASDDGGVSSPPLDHVSIEIECRSIELASHRTRGRVPDLVPRRTAVPFHPRRRVCGNGLMRHQIGPLPRHENRSKPFEIGVGVERTCILLLQAPPAALPDQCNSAHSGRTVEARRLYAVSAAGRFTLELPDLRLGQGCRRQGWRGIVDRLIKDVKMVRLDPGLKKPDSIAALEPFSDGAQLPLDLDTTRCWRTRDAIRPGGRRAACGARPGRRGPPSRRSTRAASPGADRVDRFPHHGLPLAYALEESVRTVERLLEGLRRADGRMRGTLATLADHR